jgi:predicted DNA-binding transcriptional regulator YafY
MDNGKVDRTLGIYSRLMGGYIVSKTEEAQRYGVNERTIQRDIDDIRNFLETEVENSGIINSIIYDRYEKGYKLEQVYQLKLSNSEILAICKILLESRAFSKIEMQEMLDKLISCCVPKRNQKIVKELIANEEFHYVEPRHQSQFLDTLWDIGKAIRNCNYIEVDYERIKDKKIVKRKLKPLAIMFSEYYFYVTAFIDDEEVKKDFDVINDSFPTIYRVDRIRDLRIGKEKFHIPYSSRFEEGEFRKRVQFMYGGKLNKVKFRYSGYDIDSVLDRIPTAVVKAKDEDGYIVEAEVFGEGINMWIRSQGELIKVIE